MKAFNEVLHFARELLSWAALRPEHTKGTQRQRGPAPVQVALQWSSLHTGLRWTVQGWQWVRNVSAAAQHCTILACSQEAAYVQLRDNSTTNTPVLAAHSPPQHVTKRKTHVQNTGSHSFPSAAPLLDRAATSGLLGPLIWTSPVSCILILW